MAALQWIERNINTYHIDCNFQRVDGYLFSHESDKESNLDIELDACMQVGLSVEMVQQVPGISGIVRAIRFSEHAQFNIMKYLDGLCKAILKAGGNIYCHSRATENFRKSSQSKWLYCWCKTCSSCNQQSRE
jgi:hypothetical protein